MPSLISTHIDRVVSVGLSGVQRSGPEAVFHRSWARCVKQHGLDPTRPTPARILPSHQVRDHQQRMDGFMRVARAGMEELYGRVADLGYMLLLTDAEGITLDYIGNPASEAQLKAAGLYVGADWNEAHAGTCGVGTCLVEQTTITCHQQEHFDATHIALTCTSAPLYAPNGQVLGVLDVSALHSPEARESQHLVRHLASMYAQLIEDANFLRSYAHKPVLRLGTMPGLVEVSGEVMFAFEEDGVIVAANTGARRRFGRAGAPGLVGQTLSELLDLRMDTLRDIARGHAGAGLRLPGALGHSIYHAVVMPPRKAPQAATGGMSDTITGSMPRAITGSMPPATTGSTLRDERRLPEPPRRTPAEPATPRPVLDHLMGADETMATLVRQGRRLVDREVHLLIRGETGAGKEVLARALHAASQRADQPFVAVNCAAIPESLIESELFGYTPGSFTGGKSKGMKGLVAQADGGTLFLDEIGDMPLALQTRLLRVLSESEVLPLGAERPVPVRLNVIAATHRDLRDSVASGAFREDLYYRLCGATLHLPPLRDRQDKRFLIETLFAEESRRQDLALQLGDDALQCLLDHDWPGNLRELRSALRFAVSLAGTPWVQVADLPASVRESGPGRRGGADRPAPALPVRPAEPGSAPSGDEAARLLQALKAHRWNITAAAQALAVCRATVYRQMKRHGITPPHLL